MLAAEFGVAQQVDDACQKCSLCAPRVISAENAFLVAEMMRSAVQINGTWDNRGTGWRAALVLMNRRSDIAGKTGYHQRCA